MPIAQPAYRWLIDFANDGSVGGTGSVDALGSMTVDDLGSMTVDDLGALLSLEDVSADVRLTTPLQTSYGRDQAREYAPPAAAKLTALLDNADGKFSSANSASPLFGLLNPGLLNQLTVDLAVTFIDAYAATVLVDAPSGYWRLGEPSGTSAADASGNVRTGTYTGGYTLTQAGALTGDVDTSVAFNGTTGYVTIPAFAITGPITLEAWVYFAALGDLASNPIVFSHDQPANYLRMLASGKPRFVLRPAAVQREIDAPTALSAGVWHHIVGTWVSGSVMRLYADGVEVVNSVATYAGVLETAGSPVNIGRYQASSNYYTGRIDEVAVYPTALSAARVLAHYQAGLGTLTHRVSTTYGLHYGYLDAPSELPGIRQQLVNETSLDGMAKLKAALISTAELVGQRIEVAMGACLDAAGWPAALRRLAVADTTLTRWCVDGIDAHTALRDLKYTEGGASNIFIDPATGEFVFENRNFRLLTPRCTVSQMTARASGAEPVFGQDFGYDPGVRGIVNSCTVPVNGYTLGTLGTIWTGPTPIALAAGEVRSYQVTTPADWFTAAVAPVAVTDYALTGTALASATLSRTSGKRATLTLTAGAGSCTITGLVVRGQTVTIAKTYVSNTVSGASATGVDYGLRTFASDFIPSWLPDVNTAQDFTNYVVGRYKDPVPTVRFVLNSMDETRLAAAFARSLSDRVTVIEPIRSHISGDFFVEQIADVVSMGGSHQRIFSCEQASSGAFWVLGQVGYSELGSTTRLGF